MNSTFRLPLQIFREYDIRGIVDRDLSPELARQIGIAYAQFFRASGKALLNGRKRPLISVGRDCRMSGDSYAQALIEGLRSQGCDVERLGVCPTPLTYFSVFHYGLDGGIMVTGSHNPSDYNGFKICVGKDTLHGPQIQELRKLIEKNLKSTPEPAPERGNVSDREVIPPYIEHLFKGAQARRPLKVVLDAGNGTAGNVAPELFRKLGAEVIELYCELDGRFPNHHPDPTELKNLKDLQALVLKEKADLGLAFDGDSDRIGAVDEKGKPIFGDELMVILSRDVLKKNPGATIISEVKSSHRLYQDIEAKGGKGIMWKTGHSLIKSKMKESGALLAGEMSGHIFFADRYFGYDDAIYAALRLYEIAGAHSGPVSSLIADLPPMMATPELRVECEEDKKFALVEEVRKRLTPHHKVIGIDGVRVDFGDSWGLVRASNTQPVLVLRYEAPHATRMREIREILENSLKAASEVVGHRPLEVPK